MARGGVSTNRFETKKKNGISLRNDELLDTHFKPLKIGSEIAPIQLAKDEVRLSGDVFFDNPIKSRVDIEGHQLTLSTGLGSDHYLKFETRVYGGTDYLHSYITTSTGGSNQGRLYVQPDGNLYLEPDGNIEIPTETSLSFAGNTIRESSADVLDITVGGNILMRLTETTGSGGDNVAIGIDGGCHLVIPSGSSIKLDGSSTGGTYITESSDGVIKFYCDGENLLTLTEGAVDNISTSCSVVLPATGKLHFDGSVAADTYIKESSADILDFYSGGDMMLSLDEANDKISLAATNWVAGTVSGGTVTEFSAANSAYAGMILGYTRLEGDLSNQSVFEIQDAITVEDDTHKVTFKTPPSELVEIEMQVLINRVSTDITLTCGLSDADASTGYNSIGVQYEYDYLGIGFNDDEVDDYLHVVKWVLPAAELASVGSDNTFWIGFGTGGSSKVAYITYGVRATHGICTAPFIIKATALPATIYDGQ